MAHCEGRKMKLGLHLAFAGGLLFSVSAGALAQDEFGYRLTWTGCG